MASDSRTNAGYDDLNIARKMHTFAQPGERIFVVLVSGSLSLSQSVINLVRANFDAGEGLAQAKSMYEAAREIGRAVRQVSEIDRAALRRRLQLQRPSAAERSDSRRDAAIFPDLSAGK